MGKAKDARQKLAATDELVVTIERLLLEESKRRVQRSLENMAACGAGNSDRWTVEDWDTLPFEELVGDWRANLEGVCDCFPECVEPKTSNSQWFVAGTVGGVWPSPNNLGALAYQRSMGIPVPVDPPPVRLEIRGQTADLVIIDDPVQDAGTPVLDRDTGVLRFV